MAAIACYSGWCSEDGLNWTNITPDSLPNVTRVMKLAIAPSNENVIYMMTEKPSEIHVPYSGIFNSDNTFWKYTWNGTDSTSVWEDRTENMFGHGHGDFLSYPDALISYGGYTFVLGVKPDDEDVVFIGGMSLFRSTNGFADSLHAIWMGGDPFDMDSIHWLHPDQHDMTFLPSNPDVYYTACDGGIIYTENCMADSIYWNRLNNNLITAQFYSVTIDRAGDDNNWVLGGLQDNNWYYSVTDDPGEWWFAVDLYYDGFSCKLADHNEYAIVAAYSGNIWTSQFDEGMHTQNIYYQTPDTLLSFYDPTIGSNPIFPFYCNFILDPNNNETFYYPTMNSIWRKDNMKAAMDTTLRNVGWSQLNNIDLSESVEIISLTLSKTPANQLYFGTNNSYVYRVDNAHTGNPVPVDISGDDFPINAYVACIDVDPLNAEKLFAVFSNYGVKSIYFSDNGGTNWTQESPLAMGNIMVDMIDARSTDGLVAVATQGNGIYSTYYDPLLAVEELQNMKSVTVTNYPNPFNINTTIKYELLHSGNVSLSLVDANGRFIKQLFTGYKQHGTHLFELGTSDLSSGLYFIRITTNDEVNYHKIAKK